MSVENSIVRALKGRAQAMAERRLAPFVRPAIDLESARTGLTKPGQTSKLLTDPRHHATSTMPFYSEPSGG